MPEWIMATCTADGLSQNDGLTRYHTPYGFLYVATSEIQMQSIARDTYTLSELFVRVITNGINGTTTVRTRKNGGNGNQSVSIPATDTGTFRDTVNTDALTNGNLFNYQVVTAGSVSAIVLTIISCLLSTASNTTPIIGQTNSSETSGAANKYLPLMGGMETSQMEITEADVKYTFRVTATLSNLRISAENYHLNATTIRTRINGINGSLSVSVPTDTTGRYEDAGNSDNISIGDTVNIQEARGTGTGPTPYLTIHNLGIKSNAAGRQTACATSNGVVFDLDQDWNVTLYYPLEGTTREQTSTELNVQCLTRMAFNAGNFFVNAPVNTTNGTRIVNTRINGGDGSLSVSIGPAASGVFEDLVNSDALIATDLYNFKSGPGGSSGSIVIQIVGVQLPYEVAGDGIVDKSANMGSKMLAAGLL